MSETHTKSCPFCNPAPPTKRELKAQLSIMVRQFYIRGATSGQRWKIGNAAQKFASMHGLDLPQDFTKDLSKVARQLINDAIVYKYEYLPKTEENRERIPRPKRTVKIIGQNFVAQKPTAKKPKSKPNTKKTKESTEINQLSLFEQETDT